MTNLTYHERQQLAYSNLIVRYPNPEPKYEWDQRTYFDFRYGRGSMEGKRLTVDHIAVTLPHIALPAALADIKPNQTILHNSNGVLFEFECSPNCVTAFGILPDAYSYDLVLSHERMLEIVADGHTRIIRADYDWNSYGEFIFITIADPDTKFALDFYGRGYHEQRGIYYSDWHGSINMHNEFFYKDKWQVNASDEFEKLLEEYPAPFKTIQPTPRQQLFATLADLTDDDGALTELEDYDFGDDFDDLT